MRDAAWAALARMLRWVSTTPFGVPSEPEVNRITAAIVGLALQRAALLLRKQAEQLVLEADGGPQIVEPDDVHRAADFLDHRRRAWPGSTKAREVSTVFTSAALQADRMLAAPAVKLIIAGTLPADMTPSSGRAGAVGVGQHDAERLLVGVERPELLAEHGSAGQQLAVAQRAGDRILRRQAASCRARSPSAMIFSSTVLSMSWVRKTRSDMTW